MVAPDKVACVKVVSPNGADPSTESLIYLLSLVVEYPVTLGAIVPNVSLHASYTLPGVENDNTEKSIETV